jgi:branched-chain amino acid transport system permease protein
MTDPNRIGLAVLFAAMLGLPWLLHDEYSVFLGVQFLVNLILVASLNALIGMAGQISLCQAGFAGLGGYASGVLTLRAGVPPLLGLCLGAATAALAALLVGPPALRLRGHYLAMATLGLNAILSTLFVQLVPITGGPNGLVGIPALTLPFVGTAPGRAAFLVAWAAAGLVMLGLLNLRQSRAGLAARALAASEAAAGAAGIDAARLKLQVFVLTAAMAGLAGALSVHANQYASPEGFGAGASVLLVAMVAVGGRGHVWGPLAGAAMLTFVPELLQDAEDAELLLFGAAMVAILLLFPDGIAAAPAHLLRRIRRRA